MVTIKDIVEDFKTFVEIHPQINTFLFNKFETYDEDILHTSLFFEYLGSDKLGDEMTELKVKITIADITQNGANDLDIISNLNILIRDLLTYFHDSIYGDFNTNLVMNKTDDNLIGLELFINIDINTYSCSIPGFENPYEFNFSCDFEQPGETIPYPYETTINFNYENETTPNVFYTTKSYIDENTIVWVTDNSTSGEYEYIDNGKFIFRNLVAGGVYSYPRFRIFTQATVDGYKHYRLRFKWKKNYGNIIDARLRIGNTTTTDYIVIDLSGTTGDVEMIYTGNGVASDDDQVVFLFNDSLSTTDTFEFEIWDYSFDLIEKNQIIDYREIGIGNTNYTITIANSTTSNLTLIENGTELILNNDVTGTNTPLYPALKIYKNFKMDFEPNKTYRLKFKYKLNSGTLPDGFYCRIGEYPNNYSGMYYFDASGEGEMDIEWLQTRDGTTYFNYLHLYFGNNTPILNMSIYDLELYVLDIDETGTEEFVVNGFGEQKFIVTDSSGQEDYCVSNIEVPTPTPGLTLSVPEKKIRNGSSANFRVYHKPGELTLNWGDGTIEHFTKTNTSYAIYYHDYEEPGEYDVHFYDSAMDGIYSISYSIFHLDTKFFLKFDDDFTFKYLYTYYNCSTFGSIENIKQKITNVYFYNFPAVTGDLTKHKLQQANYFRIYLLKPYTNYDYADYGVGIYGDVGTILKGQVLTGVYSKSYCDLYRSGQFTYLDRIDGAIQVTGRIMLRGYSTNEAYWAVNDAEQLAQFIIDLDNYRINTIPTIDIQNNVLYSRLTDVALQTAYQTAKANMIADGTVFTANQGW